MQMETTPNCFCQVLKEAVVVTLCQNEAEVNFQMDVVEFNVNWKFYYFLILAERQNNCFFQGLIIECKCFIFPISVRLSKIMPRLILHSS